MTRNQELLRDVLRLREKVFYHMQCCGVVDHEILPEFVALIAKLENADEDDAP